MKRVNVEKMGDDLFALFQKTGQKKNNDRIFVRHFIALGKNFVNFGKFQMMQKLFPQKSLATNVFGGFAFHSPPLKKTFPYTFGPKKSCFFRNIIVLSEQTQVTFPLRTHILQSVVCRYTQQSSQLQVKFYRYLLLQETRQQGAQTFHATKKSLQNLAKLLDQVFYRNHSNLLYNCSFYAKNYATKTKVTTITACRFQPLLITLTYKVNTIQDVSKNCLKPDKILFHLKPW